MQHHGSVYTAGTAFTFETYVNCLFGHAMEAGSDPAYSKRIAGPIFQVPCRSLEAHVLLGVLGVGQAVRERGKTKEVAK